MHDVPLSQTGYWQKMKYGKKLDKTPLTQQDGTTNTILLLKRTEREDDDSIFKSEFQKKAYKLKNNPCLNFKVPESLKSSPF